MHKRTDLDWVGYVLRDVISSLNEHDMKSTAQMLAVAAAYVEADLENRARVLDSEKSEDETGASKLVEFRRGNRQRSSPTHS